MKTARIVLCGIMAVFLVLVFTGCPNEPPADVVWTATARGAPQATAIDFEFDAPVSALAANHISVTEGTGLVTSGALTGSGTSWSLAVAVVRSGDVTVSIDRPGIYGMTMMVSFAEADVALTGTVSIDGTAEIGQTLTANTENLYGEGYKSFRWYRGTSPIAYATDSTYVLQAYDDGYTITVRVSRAGNAGNVASNPTATVTFPALTGTVSIDGNLVEGQTLTANIGNLYGEGYKSFQWYRGTRPIPYAIPNATYSTYVLQADDVYYAITVRVTRAGNAGSVTSDPTDTVIALYLRGTVCILGHAAVGHTLIVDVADLGGRGTISFQWGHENTDGEITDIIGANSDTYVVQDKDLDANITVTVTRDDNIGHITGTSVGSVTDVLPRFVRVEGGTFLMGSNPGGNVTPMRNVTLSDFYISRFQVTQGEWFDVMGTRPSWFTLPGVDAWRNLPVERVSWYDAIVFANRLSMERGLIPAYELPNVYPNPTSWSGDPADWGPVPARSCARWNNVRISLSICICICDDPDCDDLDCDGPDCEGDCLPGYRLPTEAQSVLPRMLNTV